jgi:hypothetical protein
MKLFFQQPGANGIFYLRRGDVDLKGSGIREQSTINSIVLNQGGPQQVTIDQVAYEFPGGSILPLVANQHFVFERPEELVAWQFDRDFYCIADHDAEVGCVGFLFYGIQHPLCCWKRISAPNIPFASMPAP